MTLSFLHLLLDTVLLLVAARYWTEISIGKHSPLENRLSCCFLILILQVVAVTTILGYAGWFYPWAFTLGFAVIAGATRAYVRARFPQACQLAELVRSDLSALSGGWKHRAAFDRVLLILLGGLLLTSGGLAVVLEPINYDSHNYRLPRIGHWLQEGNIYQFQTMVDPQNYLGMNADLVTAWIVGHFKEGFPLARLVQWGAGVWMLLSIAALGKRMGFLPTVRLLTLFLAFSAGVTCIEFSTTQTDLVAAAGLVGGFLFLFSDPARPWLVGLSWALSTGVKGTTYFFGPGMLLVVGLLYYRKRLSFGQFKWICASFAVGWAVLVFPKHAENVLRFSHPFASKAWMEIHASAEDEGRSPVSRMAYDAWTYALQQIEPGSNPELWSAPGKSLAGWLLRQLPQFPDDRVNLILQWMERQAPSGDRSSLGLMLPLCFLVGVLVSLKMVRKRVGAWECAVLSTSVILFFIIFVAWHRWSPFAGRFFILAVPIMALVSGCFFQQISRVKGRSFLYGGVVLWSLLFAHKVYTQSNYTGWDKIGNESAFTTHKLYSGERLLVQSLGEGVDGTLDVALPTNHLFSGFYRVAGGPKVRQVDLAAVQAYASAEAYLRAVRSDGVVAFVAPIEIFEGRLGKVSTLLYENTDGWPLEVTYGLFQLQGPSAR